MITAWIYRASMGACFMQDVSLTSLRPLLPWLPLVALLYLSALFVFFRLKRSVPFPGPRPMASWGAPEILVLFFLTYGLWLGIGFVAFSASGIPEKLYSPAAVQAVRSTTDHEQMQQHLGLVGGGSAELAWVLQKETTQLRLGLWTSAIVFPFQFLSIFGVLWTASRTRPADLGLSPRRLGSVLSLATVTWLVVAPAVLLLNVLIQLSYLQWVPGGPSQHPFAEMFALGLSTMEQVLIFLLAIVGAPLLEETLFRGLLQPWSSEAWRRWTVIGVAGILALFARGSLALSLGSTASWISWLDVLLPLLFLVAVMLALLWMERREVSVQWRAIVSTSVLFAFIHIDHWPSPIALFFLSIALGWLAVRTGSLVAPIALHMLFNSIACVQMLLS